MMAALCDPSSLIKSSRNSSFIPNEFITLFYYYYFFINDNERHYTQTNHQVAMVLSLIDD